MKAADLMRMIDADPRLLIAHITKLFPPNMLKMPALWPFETLHMIRFLHFLSGVTDIMLGGIKNLATHLTESSSHNTLTVQFS